MNSARDFIAIPLFNNTLIRTIIGFAALMISILAGIIISGTDMAISWTTVMVVSWLCSYSLTDKYNHKYPQRFVSYLIASHAKALIIMALVLIFSSLIIGQALFTEIALWAGLLIFSCADLLLSLPHRRISSVEYYSKILSKADKDHGDADDIGDAVPEELEVFSIDTEAILDRIKPDIDGSLFKFLEEHLPQGPGDIDTSRIIRDLTNNEGDPEAAGVGLLISQPLINDVRRLNQFLRLCTQQINYGG